MATPLHDIQLARHLACCIGSGSAQAAWARDFPQLLHQDCQNAVELLSAIAIAPCFYCALRVIHYFTSGHFVKLRSLSLLLLHKHKLLWALAGVAAVSSCGERSQAGDHETAVY